MALYINDKNVIKLAQTDRGIKLIVDFIESFGEVVTVDRKMAYPDILIQTQVKTLTANGTIGLSNTVGYSLYMPNGVGMGGGTWEYEGDYVQWSLKTLLEIG